MDPSRTEKECHETYGIDRELPEMVRKPLRQKRLLQMRYLLIIGLCAAAAMPARAQVRKGQPAPEISLSGLSDSAISLSSLKGKVVLLDFWASWCGPCRHNNPSLVKLYERYKDKGFEIFSVSIDKDKSDWKQAILQDGLTWTQVIDQQGWYAPSTINYGVDAIPASFLLDRQGVVKAVNKDGRELDYEISRLVRQ
jgi:thiol-disulfide isomerase/thioredoxin